MTKIYFIRGQNVMLDKDLALLYKVTTGNLNKDVARNLKRFPNDFMFQLNKNEFENLIFHFGTSSWGGVRKLPKAFTEQGVAMLSGILNSERAISVNIEIMRVFTSIRKTLANNSEIIIEIEKIKNKLNSHEKNIELVFQYLDELMIKHEEKKLKTISKNKIGFKIGSWNQTAKISNPC